MDKVMGGIKSFPWYVRWIVSAALLIGGYKLAEGLFGTIFSWLALFGMVLVPLVSLLVALNVFRGGTFKERKEQGTASWANFLNSLGSGLMETLKQEGAKLAKEALESKAAESKSA